MSGQDPIPPDQPLRLPAHMSDIQVIHDFAHGQTNYFRNKQSMLFTVVLFLTIMIVFQWLGSKQRKPSKLLSTVSIVLAILSTLLSLWMWKLLDGEWRLKYILGLPQMTGLIQEKIDNQMKPAEVKGTPA